MQVADWVFDRSPVELKQAFMAAKKRRETESVMMTRAYREKLANKQPNTSYTFAVVRVRLPEGLLLQVYHNKRTMLCSSASYHKIREVSVVAYLVGPQKIARCVSLMLDIVLASSTRFSEVGCA